MYKSNLIRLISELYQIKQKQSFQIIDCHVHPFDVMGANIYSNSEIKSTMKYDFLKPQISELLNYNLLSNKLTNAFTKYLPLFTSRIMQKMYHDSGINRIKDEMKMSLVDKCVLLPIEPWVKTQDVFTTFNGDDEFIIFGSFDLNDDIMELERQSNDLVNKYHISGIKLHPNLQNFFPNPKMNDDVLGNKIHFIYKFAERYQLPILFHSGTSFYQEKVNAIFNKQTRSKKKAILSNFSDTDGKIEILEDYDLNIILAHAGSYGLSSVQWNMIRNIMKRYKNVFFDTSGVSADRIYQLLNIVDYKSVIFGSDALYNRIAYNVAFTFTAIKKYVREHDSDELDKICKSVFCDNLLSLINFKK